MKANRQIGAVVSEIIDALDGIKAATAGKTIEDFSGDWLLRHGVQRGIEIISEAARHLPEDLLKIAPEVPWKQIRGIGNVLRHEYHKVSDPIVWAVVTDSLPALRVAIQRIQASLDPERPSAGAQP